MTTRIQFVVTDDLDYAESNGKTLTDIGPDGEKMIISLDGEVRELDLTREHAAELRVQMLRWLRAGHRPGEAPVMPPSPSPDPEETRHMKGQGKRRELPGTRDFYRELREWAAEKGDEIKLAGRDDGKKNYVYAGHIDPYIRHLIQVAARGKDGGVAAARLALAQLLGLYDPEDPQWAPAVSGRYAKAG